ncbi:MAG: hypothetical protein LBP35_06775 [Candidatus Ancillula trichonymphae]|jgi:ABC-type lipoprotein release transport system permease subunit|nr:hypothetical protein [Candidatus Ancillula trichonymphae]
MYSPLNFTIAGVVKDGHNQAMLYIPIKTLLVLAPGVLPSTASYSLNVHADNANLLSLTALMKNALHNIGVPEFDMGIRRFDQMDEAFSGLSNTITAFFYLSILILILSGFSILNVGLAIIRNKQKELSLRRAIEATRLFVFLLTLGSAVILGVIAVMLSILVTSIVTLEIPHFVLGADSLVTTIAFPTHALLGGSIVSLLIP